MDAMLGLLLDYELYELHDMHERYVIYLWVPFTCGEANETREALVFTKIRRRLGLDRHAPEPLDRVGPATIYGDRAGAWGLGRAGWDQSTQVLPRTGPLMTLAGEWRSSGRAWQL